MSLERRKPFALLYPNARPFDADPTTTTTTSTALAVAAHPTISRPRRQMPSYHYHYQLQQNPHKRYATVLPGSSRSSATSSAESLYSTTSSMPRRRKLSAAEDVAARVRARWATLEALERANSAPQHSPPAEAISASASATATIRPGARMDPRVSERPLHHHSTLAPPDSELDKEREREREKEKENAASSTVTTMQVDGYEKPLPPRPAALALAPASAGTTMAAVLMAVDDNNAGGAKPHHDDGGAGESLPTSDLTLRTTPTSLTCYETESIVRPAVLQRRPTRALTPPQVRRRPSITDELEEAREEATLAMLHSSRTDGFLRCPRRGCDELLSGVRALTFHLHIHAVGAGAAYTCVRCGGAFETARDLTRHACARRRARERLRSVVRAWTCLSSTGQSFGRQQQEQLQQPFQQPPKHYKRKDDNNYY